MYLASGDHQQALAYQIATLPDGWDEDADQLNSFAWWSVENNVALERGRKYAEKSIERAADERAKSNAMDTLAEIVNAQGDPAGAAAITEQALALHDSDFLKRQLERFRALAKGGP